MSKDCVLFVLFVVCVNNLEAELKHGGQEIPGQLLVRPVAVAQKAQVERALQGKDIKIRKYLKDLNTYVINVSEADADKVKDSWKRSGLFEVVECDQKLSMPSLVNDPLFASQWHLQRISALAAWDRLAGPGQVVVGVVDSGVDAMHKDLEGRVVNGRNFAEDSAQTNDYYGHGTAVVGVIAAVENNMEGVAGVSHGSRVMPLVVGSPGVAPTVSELADAIAYATRKGVRILNVSLSAPFSTSTLQRAVDAAWQKGTLIIAAAGNDATAAASYPAAFDHVVGVGATDAGDFRAGFSNYGVSVDLTAPGVGILTTTAGGGYAGKSGTSFSAPIVAGAAAMALAVTPGLSTTRLRQLLRDTADDLGAPGHDASFGFGRLNADRLVAAALKEGLTGDVTAPEVTIASPTRLDLLRGTVQVTGKATDRGGVEKLVLEVDGRTVAEVPGTANFSIEWNTMSGPNGCPWLKVMAYDAAGNIGTASTQTCVQNLVGADTKPPVIVFQSPSNGAELKGVTSIQITALDDYAVGELAVYLDGVLLTSTASSKIDYSLHTQKISSGEHTLEARAWDAAGNMTVSQPVVVYKL